MAEWINKIWCIHNKILFINQSTEWDLGLLLPFGHCNNATLSIDAHIPIRAPAFNPFE